MTMPASPINTLQFVPPTFDYSTESSETLLFDVSAALASFGATAASNPSVTVTDLAYNTPVVGIATPTMLSSTIVSLLLSGSLLMPRHVYRVTISFAVVGAASTVALYANLNVLF